MKKLDEVDDLDESTWPKEKKFTRENILGWTKAIFVFLTIGVVTYLALFAPLGGRYTGSGVVNISPEDAESKNYRLRAALSINDERSGFLAPLTPSYHVEGVSWPNGGRSWFSGCYLQNSESMAFCETQDGRSYYVEIEEEPKR